jgi:hypothetical protein
MNAKYNRGWRDRMKGIEWPKSYDDWKWQHQQDYERGRRAAAASQGLLHNTLQPVNFDAPLNVVRAVTEENLL